jgi:hypothetical protein
VCVPVGLSSAVIAEQSGKLVRSTLPRHLKIASLPYLICPEPHKQKFFIFQKKFFSILKNLGRSKALLVSWSSV